jgi:hypothetical protein
MTYFPPGFTGGPGTEWVTAMRATSQ